MASPMATKRMALLGVTVTAGALGYYAYAAPKSKAEQYGNSIHGTGVQSQQGGIEKTEQAMTSMEVRKAVQGKGSNDKY